MVLGNSMGFKELVAHQLLSIKFFVRTSMQSFEILENIFNLHLRLMFFLQNMSGGFWVLRFTKFVDKELVLVGVTFRVIN
jgi:hypothetical protein